MAQDDESLQRLKITRNTYQFNMRRRYEAVEHFRVKKGEGETPLQRLLAQFGRQRKPFEEKGGEAKGGAPAKPSGGIGNLLLIIGVPLLIFAFLIIFVMLSAGPGEQVPPAPSETTGFAAELNQRASEYGILSYGPLDSGQYQAYLAAETSAAGASNITLNAQLFDSPPTRQVFVLRHAKSAADIYDSFRSSLDSYLSSRGFSVVDISPSQLSNIPPGSTLIVPTGYIPQFMLEEAPPGTYRSTAVPSPMTKLVALVSSGTNVVFIGDTFDYMITSQGSVVATEPKIIQNMGLSFDSKNRPQSSDGFMMRLPLYTAKAEAGKWQQFTQVWGSISSIKMGEGYILIVPETLDGGWSEDGNVAGKDIGRLIFEAPYSPPLATSSAVINSSDANFSRIYLYLSPSKKSSGYLRLYSQVYDQKGTSRTYFLDYYVVKDQLGDINFPSSAVLLPAYLGGRRADVFVSLREKSGTPVKLYFEIVENSTVVERHEFESGATQPTPPTKKSSILTNSRPGTYFLRVVDEGGKIYAATLVSVMGLDIAGPKSIPGGEALAFREGTFNFSFSKDGRPVSVQYVKVSMPGTSAPTREYRNVTSLSYAPGVELKGSFGQGTQYTILLDFGGFQQEVALRKIVARQFWDNPMVQVLGIVGILIGAVSMMLRRPEKQLLSLDVPDFPPLSITKIPIKASTVLGIFEQINRDYSWERMPLKMEEVKNGFLKLTYNGKPIAVGDYNLQRMLERLEELGALESSLGYYGLSKWSAESGQSMLKRALFRRLRDLCITDAIRFSKLGSLPYCDMKLLIGQSEYFIHFFLGDYSVVARSLETIPLGRSWIVFQDKYELERFSDRLQDSQSASLALKMEIYNKRARLVSVDELPELLKSMKIEGA